MANDATFDQQFVEFLVQNIVENPEDVHVERVIDELGVLISLRINKADMGTVIGKNGQTAKAIRTLLRVIGSKTNARINLKIIDPEKSDDMSTDADVTSDLEI